MAEGKTEIDDNGVSPENKPKIEKMTPITEKPLDLDEVLIKELGQFGNFQIRNILMVSLPIIVCGLMAEYIFTAAVTPHRCRIPECGDSGKLQKYNPDWVVNAIPRTSSGFASCERYAPRDVGFNGTLDNCPEDLFNTTRTIQCDGFVYEKDNTVVYEYDLGCEEWLRALAGTFYSIGSLFGLPITGWISDRYGRRIALIINIFNLGIFGIIRTFSVNYTMYLILQLLETTFGAGAYSSAYIFAAELVGPKYRVFTSATTSAMFAVGQVLLGSMAWLISPWRYMIMTVHIPCFFIIVYYWLLTESVRWLLSKKKYAEATDILNTVARVNKTHISDKSLKLLTNPPTPAVVSNNVENLGLVQTIVRSPVLLRRVCTTPIWWITLTFVYYGLSINSTSLSDTTHLNFILTCAIEIPGFYTAVLLLNRIGRRITLSSGFFFSAVCNIAFVFIPSEMTVVRLTVYLLGKFGISTVVVSVYLFTFELYPTEFRHSLLAFSSMIGRIGAITAPLTPVLMIYWHGIPSLMFGCLGIISGVLALTQPETLGTKMPDTLAEAEAIGKSVSEEKHTK